MPVHVSVENGICTLTVHGSTGLNTLSRALLVDLGRALDEAGVDPGIVVVILTGDGERAFSAGADISEMRDLTSEASYAPEATLFAECFGPEQQERMSAFLEKRPPRRGARYQLSQA